MPSNNGRKTSDRTAPTVTVINNDQQSGEYDMAAYAAELLHEGVEEKVQPRAKASYDSARLS
jgi:hypothetical protein